MRTHTLLLDGKLWRQLRAAADVDESTVEAVAHVILAQAMEQRPDVMDLAERQDAALKQVRKEWANHWKQAEADELP